MCGLNCPKDLDPSAALLYANGHRCSICAAFLHVSLIRHHSKWFPGHNCFGKGSAAQSLFRRVRLSALAGAILHPIPMVDFMPQFWITSSPCDRPTIFCRMADVTDSMCLLMLPRPQVVENTVWSCGRLDGVISGFPNTYASKVGKTSDASYKVRLVFPTSYYIECRDTALAFRHVFPALCRCTVRRFCFLAARDCRVVN